ncbi:MAG: 50S ribosomal protein L21 [bacterium]|nr:50S ribosomal protein L21 [bacterium]
MYAVIELNKNQYLVRKDEEITVDKLNTGEKKLKIKNVLLYKDDKQTVIGKPYIANAEVDAEVVEDIKGKKIIIFKYKRRKGYKRKTGHRQPYTVIKIKDIKIA